MKTVLVHVHVQCKHFPVDVEEDFVYADLDLPVVLYIIKLLVLFIVSTWPVTVLAVCLIG